MKDHFEPLREELQAYLDEKMVDFAWTEENLREDALFPPHKLRQEPRIKSMDGKGSSDASNSRISWCLAPLTLCRPINRQTLTLIQHTLSQTLRCMPMIKQSLSAHNVRL